MTTTETKAAILARIRDAVLRGHRFLLTSHARPDGDSIGSELALAHALKRLGKTVRVVNRDAAPPHYQTLPGVSDIEITEAVEGDFDAAIVLECGTVSRPGIRGLDRYFIINIDHHAGNSMYGAINWFDESAAACGEMVFDLIVNLGVPLTLEIATHIYVAILTDTGSFHHSHITARTFEICRQLVEAGVDPAALAQSVYDSHSIGKLRLMGSLLDSMQIAAAGHLGVLSVDEGMLSAVGSTDGDTEGLINLPLTAREIRAVVFFKVVAGEVRVSLRSKGQVDVREVAAAYGGGGHRNASGFTIQGRLEDVRRSIIDRLGAAIDAAGPRTDRPIDFHPGPG